METAIIGLEKNGISQDKLQKLLLNKLSSINLQNVILTLLSQIELKSLEEQDLIAGKLAKTLSPELITSENSSNKGESTSTPTVKI
jgi:hypothetical protein